MNDIPDCARPDCRHPLESHLHWRDGRECALCLACPSYRAPRRSIRDRLHTWWLRVTG